MFQYVPQYDHVIFVVVRIIVFEKIGDDDINALVLRDVLRRFGRQLHATNLPAIFAAADSDGDSARAVSPEAAALREEVMRKSERIEELDFYELLGVDRKATLGDIKRAYLRAAKRYHPDALTRLGVDEQTGRVANDVFARISKAQAVLSNAKKRSEYDASLEDGIDTAEAEQLARAEVNYRKGDILLRKGNFRGAAEFLQAAVETWPQEAEYQAAYAWALFKKLPTEPEKAREHMQHAVDLDPANAVSHHRMGMVLRALGEEEAAEKASARAKELDPSVG